MAGDPPAFTIDTAPAPTPPAEAPPEERYELLAEVGQGASGVVYRAWDAVLGREVALKVPRSPRHAPGLEEERRLAAAAWHPGLLPVLDAGTLPHGRPFFEDERPFFTMPLVAAERTLERLVAREGPGRRPLEVVRRVAWVLAALHPDLAHGDPHPGNVLVGDDDQVHLVDLGHARVHGRPVRPGAGAEGYRAPELTAGAPASPASDVYALGGLLALAASGSADGAPRSRALRSVVRRCRASDPARRPSAREVARDLDRWTAGELPLLHPHGPLEAGVWWAMRHPLLAAGGALLASAAVALGSVALAARRVALEEEAARLGVVALSTLRDQGDPAVIEEAARRSIALARRPDPLVRGALMEARSRPRAHPEEPRPATATASSPCPAGPCPDGLAGTVASADGGLVGWITGPPPKLRFVGPDGAAVERVLEAPVGGAVAVPGGVVVAALDRVERWTVRGRDWSVPFEDAEAPALFHDPGRDRLVVVGKSGRITFLSLAGEVLGDLPAGPEGNPHGGRTAALSPDGALLAAGGAWSGSVAPGVLLLDLRTDVIRHLDAGPVLGATFDRSGARRLVTLSPLGVARWWDLELADPRVGALQLPPLHGESGVALSGDTLALDDGPHQVARYRLDWAAPPAHRSIGYRLLPDGDAILSAGEDGRLVRTRPDGGQEEVLAAPAALEELVRTPEGATLVFGVDGAAWLLEGAARARVAVPDGFPSVVYEAVFLAPDRLVVAGYGPEVTAWTWPGLAPVWRSRPGAGSWLGVAPAGDGAAVGVDRDGTLVVWEADGRERLVAPLDEGGIPACGRPLVVEGVAWFGCRDGGIRRYDLQTSPPARLPVLEGHRLWPIALAVLEDGRIASGGWDGDLRIWTADGAPDAVVSQAHPGGVWDLAIGADGALRSTGSDGRVRAWSVSD